MAIIPKQKYEQLKTQYQEIENFSNIDITITNQPSLQEQKEFIDKLLKDYITKVIKNGVSRN